MARSTITVLAIALAAALLTGELRAGMAPGGGGSGGGAPPASPGAAPRPGGWSRVDPRNDHLGPGSFQEYPCEWVKSIKEGAKKLDKKRELLYLYFHRAAPKRRGSFNFDPEMQKISKELLVFVDLTVPKTGISPKLKKLLRRCKVKKLPRAVISDRHGNPLYLKANYFQAKLLRAQAAKAKYSKKKFYAALEKAYEKALDFSKKRDFVPCVQILVRVESRGYVGLPVLKKMTQLLSKVNAYLEGRLKRIMDQGLPPADLKPLLAELKEKAHRTLPVYKKIVAAYETAG